MLSIHDHNTLPSQPTRLHPHILVSEMPLPPDRLIVDLPLPLLISSLGFAFMNLIYHEAFSGARTPCLLMQEPSPACHSDTMTLTRYMLRWSRLPGPGPEISPFALSAADSHTIRTRLSIGTFHRPPVHLRLGYSFPCYAVRDRERLRNPLPRPVAHLLRRSATATSAMNVYAIGDRVFFWDANGHCHHGVVQNISVQADGTHVATIRLDATQKLVTLPFELVIRATE
ncbi:hypothetical protein EVG20_g3643 [Dentipellis fragilis]|uniref:Uncharacterized protein n=1 Tax=Dentipellis fragilis TaxID=205917 RepID=A0A4Y9Z2J0_9AGAM|nr:hypothetical protein EVG20_g3643 [Dentipellis fragilis]